MCSADSGPFTPGGGCPCVDVLGLMMAPGTSDIGITPVAQRVVGRGGVVAVHCNIK
jgi:hypothetical protein